ncbi:MAG: hypothetical protein NTW87_36505, partial [Planctomycetota bacterium]|nr:hypothetical protein [Planctomycetota bacterium]
MNFAAGKTYDFSAWLKYDGVPPQLKINFAQPVTSREQVIEGQTENGWKRFTRRVTMAKDAKSNYLAVWQ